MSQIRQITEIGILTAMITILGAIKIPNLVPGIEFQLSAPLAVAICAAFGFKKYIISGCLSSLIGLALGTQNFLSVAIAMQFRLVVGFLLWICKNHMLGVILSGPIASTVAMVMLAVPGMIFTAIVAPIMTAVFKKVVSAATHSAPRKVV